MRGIRILSETADQLPAVHDRHHQVGDDEIRARVDDGVECRLAVERFDDVVARCLENDPEHEKNVGLIVDDKDFRHGSARLPHPCSRCATARDEHTAAANGKHMGQALHF